MKLLKDFPFTVKIPIAWGDMDAFGHVNNIRYFKYFETARIAFFEKIGLVDIMNQSTIGPILAATSAKFIKPVVYPDTISVGTRITSLNDENKFSMEYLVESEKLGTVAIGEAVIVIIDYKSSQKVPLPLSVEKKVRQLQPELQK